MPPNDQNLQAQNDSHNGSNNEIDTSTTTSRTTDKKLETSPTEEDENRTLIANPHRRKNDFRYTTRLALIMTGATILMLIILTIIFNVFPRSSSANRRLEDNEDEYNKCEAIYEQLEEDRCTYAYSCDDNDGIPFFPYLFCLSSAKFTWTMILMSPIFFILVVTLFRMLGSTAEDYFSPSLEMFSCKMGLPPRFAGVTLLALGNGAADVSATVNAIISNPNHGYQMSLGALTGAGMFVGCIVSGVVIVVAQGVPCRGALVRDVITYGIALALVWTYLGKKKVMDAFAIHLFVSVYVSFVCIVFIADMYHRKVVMPRLMSQKEQQEMRQQHPPPPSIPEDTSLSLPDQGPEPLLTVPARIEDGEEIRVPIPLRAVNSVLVAMSNYSTNDITSLQNETNQVLHGKHGIIGTKHDRFLLPTHSPPPEEEEEHMDFDLCGNPYSAMIDTIDTLEIDTWCTTHDSPNRAAPNWKLAAQESTLELKQHFVEFWNDVFQMDVNWLEKLLFLCEFPSVLLRKLTIPVPTDGYYCRPLVALSIALSPLWLGFYFLFMYQNNVFDRIGIPWFWILEAIAMVMAAFIIRMAPRGDGPMALIVAGPIAFYGFIIAATWIDIIADRLVCLLSFFGIVCRIPSSIMGLTILAWGNSMSDLSANLAMARKGLANMAITACYAGPVFNILIGLAFGFFQLLRITGETYHDVVLNPSIHTGFGFLIVNCVILLMSGLVFYQGFIPAQYGYIALALYSAYVITSIVLEFR